MIFLLKLSAKIGKINTVLIDFFIDFTWQEAIIVMVLIYCFNGIQGNFLQFDFLQIRYRNQALLFEIKAIC